MDVLDDYIFTVLLYDMRHTLAAGLLYGWMTVTSLMYRLCISSVLSLLTSLADQSILLPQHLECRRGFIKTRNMIIRVTGAKARITRDAGLVGIIARFIGVRDMIFLFTGGRDIILLTGGRDISTELTGNVVRFPNLLELRI